VRRADNLHVPIVFKSGSLNLLEPSGPVQACNGIALPFTFCLRTKDQCTLPLTISRCKSKLLPQTDCTNIKEHVQIVKLLAWGGVVVKALRY